MDNIKPKIKEAIIVEGRYDKIKLSSLIDAIIIEIGGFRVFKDKEQMAFIRTLAETNGLIILTDSDSAGFMIRSHLTGSVDNSLIKQAYIPDIYGKEKRKDSPSKEGKLGVEGVPADVIIDALTRAGATFCGEENEKSSPKEKLTKADLFELGITGGSNSHKLRRELLKELDLPEKMSTNSLLKVVNEAIGKEKFLQAIKKMSK